ncbi:hypothetical protein FNH13_17630 [Ornithinimicrobium ciconiae]|uniref:Helix-turn-helix domain-containing protein n=1 Tax=Ornithinimicrobium ciconiae TaxID=2594265 RepID=A0A516GEH1_9MICO|nr:hypothetical protein [Ornithinimicrobium ciconiae]QDO89922.1 hypothetical protein FNH13_17630 [Ornithinimicrobium ciconiae]
MPAHEIASAKELRAATRRLAALEEQRLAARSRHDAALAEFLQNGGTWVEAMELAGLSRRGIQLALQRVRTGDGESSS